MSPPRLWRRRLGVFAALFAVINTVSGAAVAAPDPVDPSTMPDAPDMNADGVAEVLAPSIGFGDPTPVIGKVSAISPSLVTGQVTVLREFQSLEMNDLFGFASPSAGDVNGDGSVGPPDLQAVVNQIGTATCWSGGGDMPPPLTPLGKCLRTADQIYFWKRYNCNSNFLMRTAVS